MSFSVPLRSSAVAAEPLAEDLDDGWDEDLDDGGTEPPAEALDDGGAKAVVDAEGPQRQRKNRLPLLPRDPQPKGRGRGRERGRGGRGRGRAAR